MSKAKDKQLYLIHVWGDIEPALSDPFDTEEERIVEAKRIRKEEPDDGIYRLDVNWKDHIVSVDTFTGVDLEDPA